MPRALLVVLLFLLAVPAVAQEVTPVDPAPEPRTLTTQEDHRLMMKALGIDALRPGANEMDPKAQNDADYDEAKVNPFTLPDPLVCEDGELAWRQHKGGHTTGPNWPVFLEFAGRYVGVKDAAGSDGDGSE